MQELVYQHGIHSCLNYNIEALRDAVEVIGLHEMTNAYHSMAWGITEGGRLVVMITDRRYNGSHNSVIVEFEGDGCLSIWKCNSYGKPINDREYELFDTHTYNTSDKNHAAFESILKTKYDIVY